MDLSVKNLLNNSYPFYSDKLFWYASKVPMLLKTQNSFLVNSKLKGFEPKEYFDSYNILKEFIEKFIK